MGRRVDDHGRVRALRRDCHVGSKSARLHVCSRDVTEKIKEAFEKLGVAFRAESLGTLLASKAAPGARVVALPDSDNDEIPTMADASVLNAQPGRSLQAVHRRPTLPSSWSLQHKLQRARGNFVEWPPAGSGPTHPRPAA